ncbi:hypothetical protein VSDG_06001 [Cytospora chrysosperma]|uniref:Rhodopsin domain-containing protein n=1 Tax=Cytospora chrysosperma TaxID=252740 RepID=A0A423VW50_CYTCH|nr:hypothetical protein VSDG_06001 [Valsa sordida]
MIGRSSPVGSESVETKLGLGIAQLDDMPVENTRNFLLIEYIGSPFYVLCLFGFKFSLLMSYLRFIPFGICNLGAKCMAVAVAMAHMAFVLCFIFSCNPVAKFWDTSSSHGSCIGVPFYTAFSVLTISFDIIIMLLPLPTFIQTQIPIRKKVIIVGLFTLGIFITVVQIIRFHSIKTLVNLVDSANPITWSIVEGNLGIITTCIPTLAPLVRYFSELSRLDGESARARCGTNRASSGGGGIGSRRHAHRPSLHGGLRGAGVEVSGTDCRDSTELVHIPNGIPMNTELVVGSFDELWPDELETSEDNLTEFKC